MRIPAVAIGTGAGLGLLDGLSAWFYPEARPMLMTIIAGSTIKGVVTGLIAGLVAQRTRSMGSAVAAGAIAGFLLSTLAAQGQPDHYWSIVLPGMLVGVIVGVIAQRRAIATAAVVMLVATAQAASAQTPATPPPPQSLATLDGLVGKWQGTSEGQPGRGTVEREYTRILRSRFVQSQNRSVYAPQEKNPKGEEHLDTAVFSFDRQRKQIVMRQFHVEGFVNQYVLQSATPTMFVFVSEAIENIPAGYRARETYRFISADEFEETFEMAEPGKDFAVYSQTKLKRVK